MRDQARRTARRVHVRAAGRAERLRQGPLVIGVIASTVAAVERRRRQALDQPAAGRERAHARSAVLGRPRPAYVTVGERALPRPRPSTSGGDIDITRVTKAVVSPARATWPCLVAVPVKAVYREAGLAAIDHEEAPHHLLGQWAGNQLAVSSADIDAKLASPHRYLAARADEPRRRPDDWRALRGMTCTGRRGTRTRFGGVPAASADQQRNEHDRRRDTPKCKHLASATGVATGMVPCACAEETEVYQRRPAPTST